MLAVRLFDESSSFLLPGTFESLRADIGLTYAQVSSAFVMIAAGGVAGAATTVAADYRSRRVICAAGAATYGLALLLIGAADSYTALAAGSFLVGVASTALVDASEIALADEAGDDLERHLTTQNVLGSLGDLLGPALVVALVGVGLPWRACFFAGAALVMAYGAWLATLPFPPPHPREDGETVRGAVAAVVRDPLVWLVGLVHLLLGPLDEPVLAFLIAHLEDARGVGATGATLVAAASVVGAFGGYATLRRRRGVLPVDAALLAVATTCLVAAPGAVVAAIASLLVGMFLVRVWIDVQARILTLRPGQTGTVRAVVTVVETVGWGLPVLAGVVADRVDVTAGLAAYAGVAWMLAAASLALARAARRPRAESPLLAP